VESYVISAPSLSELSWEVVFSSMGIFCESMYGSPRAVDGRSNVDIGNDCGSRRSL